MCEDEGARNRGAHPSPTRRGFLRAAAFGALAAPSLASGGEPPAREKGARPVLRGSFSADAEQVRFFTPALGAPLKIMVIGDTHLFMDDERGEPFRSFSARMAGAYHQTKHVKTGLPTAPQESFEKAVQLARETAADLFAMVGDIFSFPSEAAIEWAQATLKRAGVPFLYVAGNHDWHYEGMEGTEAALRSEWLGKRLLPLYQGNNPLMAAYDVKGVRFVAIDNSTYEILPEQLAFFREQVSCGLPLVLLMHIPLYAPGRPLGFGCGHPQWGAASDRNWRIERRMKWPEAGHTPVTLAFHREVFEAPSLLGVFTGHLHQACLDVTNGVPQFVTAANAQGAHMTAEFLPQPRPGLRKKA